MNDAHCDKHLLLQAEFDGELDAAESAALAEHRAQCVSCRENWETLAAAAAAMREATRHRAAPALRQAIEARIGTAAPAAARRRYRPWREAAGFVAGVALAASIALFAIPARHESLIGALVDDHVRALQPGHFTDVLSSDQHTVKPWFDGRLDFAPPVKDLAAQGFPLVGGRLDYLDGRAVAALAYTHGKHPIDLFVWPAKGGAAEPGSAGRDGYNVVHWTADGMSLWAVSDLERDQLEDFARDWRQAP